MSLRFVTAGESHGPGLTAIVEGLPAGAQLRPPGIRPDSARAPAQPAAGARLGAARGTPAALRVDTRDYRNGEERMNPWPVEAEVAEVHLPRPGHADLVGTWKYRLTDVRDVLERGRAR